MIKNVKCNCLIYHVFSKHILVKNKKSFSSQHEILAKILTMLKTICFRIHLSVPNEGLYHEKEFQTVFEKGEGRDWPFYQLKLSNPQSEMKRRVPFKKMFN